MGERTYGIALSPKIYSMMSDKLYTDRIGSAVREVCSNAWDAQMMSAKAEGADMRPFKVTLPTDLEPHFIVEDTGPGMPDETAQNLFSTLGLSTKENTNDQIGAFGLGSKSPFAVTDTFTVENTFEGTTHYYLCFKTEKGLPSLLKTGEKQEGRPSGVKVIVPAPGYKYNDYKNALNKQLIVMDPKPVINNLQEFEFIEPVRGLQNEFGYILENATDFKLTSKGIYARMGMVLYPVDIYQVSLNAGIQTNLGVQSALVLEFPIGALEPLPSREGLTYDAATIANIKEVYGNFAKDYKKRLRKSIEDQPSPLAAWREIQRLRSTLNFNLIEDGIYVLGTPINSGAIPNIFPKFDHTWQGPKNIYTDVDYEEDGVLKTRTEMSVESVDFNATLPVFVSEQFHRSDLRLNVKREVSGFERMDFATLNSIDQGEKAYLLYDEADPKHRISRLKSWLNTISYRQTYHIVKLDHRYTGDLTLNDFEKCLKQIEPGLNVKITRLSEVPVPVREKTERTAEEKSIDGINLVQPGYSYENSVKWSELEDLNTQEFDADGEPIENKFIGNCFYVTCFRRDLNDYKGIELTQFKEFARDHKMHMIIVQKTGMAHLKRLKEMEIHEFKEFLAIKMEGFTPSEDYKRFNSANAVEQDFKMWFNLSATYALKPLIPALVAAGEYVHPLFKMIEDVKRLKNFTPDYTDVQLRLMTAIRARGFLPYVKDFEWAKVVEIDMSVEFTAALNNFMTMYPVFELMLRHHGYSENLCSMKYQYLKDYNVLRGNPRTEPEPEFEVPYVVADLEMDDIEIDDDFYS